MNARLPDGYFDQMYAAAADPWDLATRWYEQRKYAITMALLPDRRYRHAFVNSADHTNSAVACGRCLRGSRNTRDHILRIIRSVVGTRCFWC